MIPFLEKLLQILAQGGFVATYKYAVMLGLIDLCIESGTPPTSVTTAQLARRVVELYWRQGTVFDGKEVLKQNTGNQAKIARLVACWRQDHQDVSSPGRSQARHPRDFRKLLDEVEWVLIEYPLPRLQRVGRDEDRFIYEIGWSEDVSRAAFNLYKRGDAAGLDNRILFKPGSAEALVALSSVIRPLIEHQWMLKVCDINGLPEARLLEFMFGAERVPLGAMQGPLRSLQNGRCFYCGELLATQPSQVDHFLPWSRYPDNGLDNLLLAHASCNHKKRNFLADLDFGHRWEERSRERSALLDEIAAEVDWERDRERSFRIVSTVYQGLPEGVSLWAGGGRFRRVEARDLEAVHGFGRRLMSLES